MKNKVTQAFLSCLIALISVLASTLLLEGVLRLKNSSQNNYEIEMWRYAKELKVRHASLGHDHVLSKSVRLQNVDVRLNSFGLRGPEIGAKLPDERRILFLGSSITFGWGVSEDQTVTGRLQKSLSTNGKPVTVLNAGIGNYNSERYVERFIDKLAQLEPTDIVVQYFLRDAEVLELGRGSWLLRNSQLAVTLWNLWPRTFKASEGNTLTSHYQAVYQPESEGVKRMEKALTRLSDYCKKKNIRMFLAMTPDVHQLVDYPFADIHKQMEVLSNKLGYKFVDLLPSLRGLTPKEIFALPGDPHPNALGHERMAAALLPYFVN